MNASIWNQIDHGELITRRRAYAYPAVGLDGSWRNYSIKAFNSHFHMENYFQRLLHSQHSEEVVLAYLGIIYWGHVSGTDGRNRSPRALARVKLALSNRHFHDQQKELDEQKIAAIVRTSNQYLKLGKYGKALSELARLPQIGFAFASKICAFLFPEKCGVIDSVIAEKYPELNFSLDGNGMIKGTKGNATYYDNYCNGLQILASQLNSLGEKFHWENIIDGTFHPWRALDVERALYAPKAPS